MMSSSFVWIHLGRRARLPSMRSFSRCCCTQRYRPKPRRKSILSFRLPTFDDRASLPYVDAILQELVKWNPVAPLGKFQEIRRLSGMPHATTCTRAIISTKVRTHAIRRHAADASSVGALVLINVWHGHRAHVPFFFVDDHSP